MKNTWLAVAVIGALVARVAVADGIPRADALRYSGVLLGAGGTPLASPQNIGISLWNVEQGGTATPNQKCITPAASRQLDPQGHFSVPLDSGRHGAVANNPDLWLEVSVGGTSLPRTRVSAAPYAVEASRANRVVLSVPDGGRTTVDGLFCGSTSNTNGDVRSGGLTGYRAAKRLCEQACNASPTAHMCTAFEAIRFYELGGDLPYGWIKSGAGVYTSYPGGAAYSDDCHGWSTESQSGYTRLGLTFDPRMTSGIPTSIIGTSNCTATLPILCCD
ncbi:MAG: hypothetical protein Q8L14_14205 [Myxococcales bacterium]|nr:hypothetical protein [Myxococcales bacterium]